jgi:hypothetical protein
MPRDSVHGECLVASHEVVNDGAGAERRRVSRRRLPFGRGAVLRVAGRTHIVGIADVSVTGAYLVTRAPVSAGETHTLELLVPPARVALELRVEVVRVSLADHESLDHPRGVAVRFLHLDETSRGLLEGFVHREPRRRSP